MKHYSFRVDILGQEEDGPIATFVVLASDLEDAKKKANWAVKITLEK